MHQSQTRIFTLNMFWVLCNRHNNGRKEKTVSTIAKAVKQSHQKAFRDTACSAQLSKMSAITEILMTLSTQGMGLKMHVVESLL